MYFTTNIKRGFLSGAIKAVLLCVLPLYLFACKALQSTPAPVTTLLSTVQDERSRLRDAAWFVGSHKSIRWCYAYSADVAQALTEAGHDPTDLQSAIKTSFFGWYRYIRERGLQPFYRKQQAYEIWQRSGSPAVFEADKARDATETLQEPHFFEAIPQIVGPAQLTVHDILLRFIRSGSAGWTLQFTGQF